MLGEFFVKSQSSKDYATGGCYREDNWAKHGKTSYLCQQISFDISYRINLNLA